jgi:hypothetical protein
MMEKVNGLCRNTRDVLAGYSRRTWHDDVKEVSFKKLKDSMTDAEKEAAGIPDHDAATKASLWGDGLITCKIFAKQHRGYMNSNRKHARLIELSAILFKHYDFVVRVVEIKPDVSYVWLYLKAKFYHSIEVERKSLVDAFLFIDGLGLHNAFEQYKQVGVKRPAPGATEPAAFGATRVIDPAAANDCCPNDWFTVIMVPLMSENLERTKGNDATALKDLIEENIKFINNMKPKYESFLGNFIDGCSHYLVHLETHQNVDSHTTKDISASQKFLSGSKAFTKLNAVLHFSSLGSEITCTIKNLLAVSDKDGIGDTKMDRSFSILEDSRLPALQAAEVSAESRGADDTAVADGAPTLSNFHLIENMGVADTVIDSVTHCVEALKHWQKRRMEESTERLATWLELAVSRLEFTDATLSVHLACLSKAGGLPLGSPANDNPDAALYCDQIVAQAADLRTTYSKIPNVFELAIEETTFMKAINIVTNFVQKGLPGNIQNEVCRNVDNLRDRLHDLASHVTWRQAWLDVVDGLAMIATRELKTPANTLDEWQCASRNGDSTKTLLAAMLDVNSRVEVLFEEMNKGGFKEEFSDATDLALAIPIQFDGALKNRDACQSDMHNYMAMVKYDPLIIYCRKCSSACFARSVDAFTQSLYLCTIKCPCQPKAPEASDYSRFYNADKGEPDMVYGKLLTKENQQWPCDQNKALVEMVSNAILDFNISYTGPLHDDLAGQPHHTWTCTSKSDWDIVATILVNLSKIAFGFKYLDTRFHRGKETFLRDGTLKNEVEMVVKNLKGACASANTCITTKLAERHYMPLPFPKLAAAKDYVVSATAVINAFARDAITSFFESTISLTQDLQLVTPAYGHIISDTTFNKQLAKKHLLGYPSRQALNEVATRTYTSMSEIGRVHKAMGLTPELDVDPEFADEMEQIRAIYASARKALSVIAGVNVILEVPAAMKKEQASFLLTAQRADLPAALVEHLSKI